MKKTVRLDPILKIKKAKEKLQAQELANATRLLDEGIKEMEKIKQERHEQEKKLEKEQTGNVEPSKIKLIQGYIDLLKERISSKKENVDKLENNLKEARTKLSHLSKGKKILENLKDRQLIMSKKEDQKKEAHQQDQQSADWTLRRNNYGHEY